MAETCLFVMTVVASFVRTGSSRRRQRQSSISAANLCTRSQRRIFSSLAIRRCRRSAKAIDTRPPALFQSTMQPLGHRLISRGGGLLNHCRFWRCDYSMNQLCVARLRRRVSPLAQLPAITRGNRSSLPASPLRCSRQCRSDVAFAGIGQRNRTPILSGGNAGCVRVGEFAASKKMRAFAFSGSLCV